MPRFKTPDYGLKMIPVDFQRQVLPGSFEFALCHLVDKELDLSALRSRFRNDAGGAPAFDPAVLLKIVLLAYSRGLVSSRSIEAACRNNVLFMAVSGDACPHFTTLAAFVSELGDEVARLFAQVLVVCDRQRLIGRELFAIDGVKLPSNASKEKSGTRADFERQAAKMEAAVKAMMERQVAADALPTEADEARATRTRERLSREAAQIRQWLAEHPADRQGSKGSTRLSNRTDNESAKMAAGKGKDCTFNGYAAMKFRGAERDCMPCPLRQQCLRKPDTTKARQVAFFQGKRAGQQSHTGPMKAKIDSAAGKHMIAARFATVEPVFGNLRHNKRLTRFTLRGRAKVDGQWKRYCMVHNIEKLAHHGYGE